MGGDAKYGRLFTEDDVRRLIQRAYHRLTEPGVVDTTLAELVDLLASEGEPVTFPADEPLFLLRGQDALAPHVVRHYATLADDPSAVSEEHRAASFRAADTLAEWQAQNPSRVKVPD